jgi:hypothetical protein
VIVQVDEEFLVTDDLGAPLLAIECLQLIEALLREVFRRFPIGIDGGALRRRGGEPRVWVSWAILSTHLRRCLLVVSGVRDCALRDRLAASGAKSVIMTNK